MHIYQIPNKKGMCVFVYSLENLLELQFDTMMVSWSLPIIILLTDDTLDIQWFILYQPNPHCLTQPDILFYSK